MNINIYMQIFAKYILYVCVSLFIYNKHAQYTHTYSIYLANINKTTSETETSSEAS